MPHPVVGPFALRIPDAVDQINNADDAPCWKFAKALLRRGPAHVLRQQLPWVRFWASGGVNQQRSAVVSAPGTILDIFAQVQDRVSPRLPNCQYAGCKRTLLRCGRSHINSPAAAAAAVEQVKPAVLHGERCATNADSDIARKTADLEWQVCFTKRPASNLLPTAQSPCLGYPKRPPPN